MNKRWNFRGRLGGAAKSVVIALSLALFGQTAWAQDAAKAGNAKRPNVLFIAVDDLRPLLGCYGNKVVKTPHIDKLAATGTVFNRAYCQQAVCAPSRNSLLTGRRPDTIGIYDLQTYFRTKLPDVVTLPQHFKGNGYFTVRMGKIFHTGHGNSDDAPSWSVQSDQPKGVNRDPSDIDRGPRGNRKPEQKPQAAPQARSDLHLAAQGEGPGAKAPARKSQPPYAMPDVPDDQLGDGRIAGNAIAWMRELKDRPFFLAVGFLKPHLPFVAPKRYWDLYDPAKFTLAEHRTIPAGAPPYASNGVGELRTYDGIPKQGPVSDEQARRLIHGYHAAVSYMDAQVGRVLDELDRLKLRDNTIIVLWGDHGFQLGEHGNWCKHNNYEKSTNAPLIVSAPHPEGTRRTRGAKTDALTEFVDIYPSLCELAGLPLPHGLEGISFVPLLEDPNRAWKKAAFSQWPKRAQGRKTTGMGHALRTGRYRFVEWTEQGKEGSEVELYDYQADPLESVNIAKRPENARLVAEMRKMLHDGWRAALPPQRQQANQEVNPR
jgi:arylsulfatase A-like enzyme